MRYGSKIRSPLLIRVQTLPIINLLQGTSTMITLNLVVGANYNYVNAHHGGRYSGYRGRGGGPMNYRETRVICQLCGKPGHVAIKCFNRFDVHFTGVTTSPQAYVTDTTAADHSQEEPIYETPYDPCWYVDNGATNHITYDPTNLKMSTPYTGTEQEAV